MKTNPNMATELADAKSQNDPGRIDEQEEPGKENEIKTDEFCFECKKSLTKSPELINVTGQPCRSWHPECFRCMICGEPMGDKQSCHVYKDQVVCRADYMRLKCDNSIRCKRCNWPIGASDWVSRGANFGSSDIFTVNTSGSFLKLISITEAPSDNRQLNTGEQFVIDSQPSSAIGFKTSEGSGSCGNETIRLMCKLHFTIDNQRIQSENNSKSGANVTELVNGMLNQTPAAAESDVTYSQSDAKLENEKRKPQQEHASHDESFHLISKAASTSTAIASAHSLNSIDQNPSQARQTNRMATKHQHQIVQQRLLTHISMFKDHPSLALSPPASGTSIDENFNISQHQRGPSSSSTTSSSSSLSVTNLTCPNGPQAPVSPAGCTSSGNAFSGAGSGGSNSSGGGQSKSKRVRTTFTEDQLSILQTHFQIDSNPDGQDLERIATITGLSKRVTQVWFQNSRARQKKYMIKRKPSASLVSNLTHAHHLHQNQHFNLRQQHTDHTNLIMINQSMIGCSGLNSPSPDLDNAIQARSNEHSQLLDQSMNLKNLPGESHVIAFSSPAESEQKGINGKINDGPNDDLARKEKIKLKDLEDYDLRIEDDEKSESSSSFLES